MNIRIRYTETFNFISSFIGKIGAFLFLLLFITITSDAIALTVTSTTCAEPHTEVSSGGGSVAGWSNLSNGGEGSPGDDAYVTWSGTTKSKTTYYAKFKGFGFSLGANAIIEGITVTIQRKGSATGSSATVSDASIKLIDEADVIGGIDHSAGAAWSAVEGDVTFGSGTDLWEIGWTGAKVSDPDFGIAIAGVTAGSGGGPFTYNFYIDYVTITITYSLGFTATSAAGGCWNDGATWGGVSPGVAGTDYPGVANVANIPGGKSVSVCTGSTANCLTLNINSDQHVSLGATLTLADATSTLNVLGTANMKTTTAATGGFASGTINMNGGNLAITGDLIITADKNGANSTTNVIAFGGGTLTVNGNLTMSADNAAATNTLNMTAANSTLDLGGTLTLGTGGTLSNGSGASGTIQYGSGAAQTVLSAITYNNLTYDGAGLKTLDGNTTVKGTLTMNNGDNNLAGSTLTLGASTAAIGTLSHTSGTLYGGTFTRWFNTSTIADDAVEGLFPIGTSTDYRPFNVSMPATGPSAGGTLSITHTDPGTAPANVSFADGASTVAVRSDENWVLTAANSFNIADGNLNVSTSGTNMGSVGDVADLRMTLVGSVIGTAGTNSAPTSNPVVRRTGMPPFTASSNTFYWGSVNASNSPLPIELLYFNALVSANKVDISWTTASETNNDYFTLERTTDGVNFEEIGTITGNGNSTKVINYASEDNVPYDGVSYYRLKQTDFDGKFTYSDLKMINFESEPDFSFDIYPNPNDGMVFSMVIIGKNMDVLVVVRDMLGNELYSNVLVTKNNDTNINAIDPSQKLPPGVYTITATSDDKIWNKRLVVN